MSAPDAPPPPPLAPGCTDDEFNSLWQALPSSFSQAEAQSFVTVMCATMGNDIMTTVASVATNSDSIGGLTAGLNCLYLVICGALVFVMHGGFAMLCAGAIRHKNTMNILLQTVLDAAVSAIAFYTVGYAFAYGLIYDSNGVLLETNSGFIGSSLFGLARYISHDTWQNFFFQWAFAATATTIPAGCVAERFNFNAYLGYSFFVAAFVYPVVVHWVWSAAGWLGYLRANGFYHLFGSGMIDFAGSAVVHMTGGLTGMMGAILVGPRLGRFDSAGKPVDMPGHSPTLVVLGTVLLWFGWYGFNPGSVLLINTVPYATIVARAAVTTTLSGAAGAVTALVITFIRHKAWDVISVCNGALVGFVAITAGAHVLEPWAALIDGFVAAFVFEGVCMLFLKLRIDDPLSAAPMHAFCGAWGVFCVGLLAKKEYILEAYGGSHDYRIGTTDEPYPYGAFYPGSDGTLIASQVIGILTIATWVCGLTGIFFAIFKFLGMLRISANEEYAGLDVSKHGGSAYVVFNDGQAVPVQLENKDANLSGNGPLNGKDAEQPGGVLKL